MYQGVKLTFKSLAHLLCSRLLIRFVSFFHSYQFSDNDLKASQTSLTIPVLFSS